MQIFIQSRQDITQFKGAHAEPPKKKETGTEVLMKSKSSEFLSIENILRSRKLIE